MKILFATHKTMHGYESDLRQSPHEYCSIGAAEALGFDIKRYWFDVSEDGHKALAAYASGWNPDLIVATPLVNFAGNIEPELFRFLRDRYKIPVIGLWLESAPNVVLHADMYAPHVTANVFVDTAEHWKQFTSFADKTFWLPEPKDPRIFYSAPFGERDIPLSFIGSTSGRLDRALNLGWLDGMGIAVTRGGGIVGQKVDSIDAYAWLLRRSKITLNFTSAVTFQHLNGRTSEATLCGAMLMESANDETPRLLDEFKHYVKFSEPFHLLANGAIGFEGASTLVDRLKYYLGPGQNEAARIAEAGAKKAKEIFDGRQFWKGMFRIAGLA